MFLQDRFKLLLFETNFENPQTVREPQFADTIFQLIYFATIISRQELTKQLVIVTEYMENGK